MAEVGLINKCCMMPEISRHLAGGWSGGIPAVLEGLMRA